MSQCKICKIPTESFMDTQLRKKLWHCNNCELIYLDKNHFVDANSELGQYQQHNNSLENEGYVNMFLNFISKFKPFCKNPVGAILDFGSGPTPVLSQLMEREGLGKPDIYDPFFAPEKVYEGNSYDLITSTEVFEHFHEPVEMIELIAGLLKPGGILAVMTMFHNNDLEFFQKWWYRRDPTHVTFYSPKTFEVIAEKFGLKVLLVDEKNTVVLRKGEK